MRSYPRSASAATWFGTVLLLAACGGAPVAPSSAAAPRPATAHAPSDAPAPAAASTVPTTEAADSTPTPGIAASPAPAAPTSAAATDSAVGRGLGACAGMYDEEKGIAAASRNALASYFVVGGFGNDARFELLPDQRMTYVVVNYRDGGARCFRGPVTPEAVATFREALVRAGACRLPRDTGRPVADRGPLTFVFRLPGLACQARLAAGHRVEADRDRLESVFKAFDALGTSVCGPYCRRGAE